MKYLIALCLCLLPVLGSAQTYTASSQAKWDAPTNAMDAADAASFTYRIYVNSSTTGVPLASVTCTAPVAPDVTFSCSAPLPSAVLAALNRRKASAHITAEDTTTPVSGESGPSNTFTVNRRPNSSTQYRQVP